MKLGAIDVGSNAMRVLIGEVTKPVGKWHYSKIAYLRLPVRLGEEVFEKGKISDEKIEKFVEGMRIFKNYLDFYGVSDYRAVATSAMRDSSNAKKIIQRVKKELGITLEVITGKEEAELVYLTFQLIPDLKMNYVLIDVGGGSTEITLFQDNKVHAAKSFQIGSVRLLKNKVSKKSWGFHVLHSFVSARLQLQRLLALLGGFRRRLKCNSRNVGGCRGRRNHRDGRASNC